MYTPRAKCPNRQHVRRVPVAGREKYESSAVVVGCADFRFFYYLARLHPSVFHIKKRSAAKIPKMARQTHTCTRLLVLVIIFSYHTRTVVFFFPSHTHTHTHHSFTAPVRREYTHTNQFRRPLFAQNTYYYFCYYLHFIYRGRTRLALAELP